MIKWLVENTHNCVFTWIQLQSSKRLYGDLKRHLHASVSMRSLKGWRETLEGKRNPLMSDSQERKKPVIPSFGLHLIVSESEHRVIGTPWQWENGLEKNSPLGNVFSSHTENKGKSNFYLKLLFLTKHVSYWHPFLKIGVKGLGKKSPFCRWFFFILHWKYILK